MQDFILTTDNPLDHILKGIFYQYIKFNVNNNSEYIAYLYPNNSQLYYEQFYRNGKLHRIDGPAYRTWFENGQLGSEVYYRNGKLHRVDGPAYRTWFENGQLSREVYYRNGKVQ